MNPQRSLTKRQKKEIAKNKLGSLLIILGLLMIVLSLFFTAFFEKKEKPISPLSKDQTSDINKIENKLKEKNIEYKIVETEKDLSYRIRVDDKKEIFIDSKKSIDQQLSSLQLILTQLKIEGKAYKRLDFRYQKPIIQF